MTKILDTILSFFYPNRCIICEKIVDNDLYLCQNCVMDFSINPSRHTNYYPCDIACSAFPYDSTVRLLIKRFKFKGNIKIGDFFTPFLSEVFRENFSESNIDFIISVPMSKHTRKQRKFNHSKVLAQNLGLSVHIPYQKCVLYNTGKGNFQHQLSAEQRKENAQVSYDFRQSADVKGKNILLIDDIITTGNTIKTCAKLLKENGAAKIYVISVASTRR